MKYKSIAQQRLLEDMIYCVGRGYNERDTDNTASSVMGTTAELTEKQHAKVIDQMQKEISAFRDRLVRANILEGGVPLPWELG